MKITEKALRSIIRESVRKVLKENPQRNSILKSQFTELLSSAQPEELDFIVGELLRDEKTCRIIEYILNHLNGYGYGGNDIYGNSEF
jgi:hypothetical protein